MSDQPPRVLNDRYEIHRRLARGGMAQVYLARDRSLDRPVAVKELVPEFAVDPSFVERFRREAQAAAGLSNANIVGVFDWGEQDGTYFIVMEYVDGPSLAQVLRADGPLHPNRAAEIASEVAGCMVVAIAAAAPPSATAASAASRSATVCSPPKKRPRSMRRSSAEA